MSYLTTYFIKTKELEKLQEEIHVLEQQTLKEIKDRVLEVRETGLKYDVKFNQIIPGLPNHNFAVHINMCVEKLNKPLWFDQVYSDSSGTYVIVSTWNDQQFMVPSEFVEYDGDDLVDWVRQIYALGQQEFQDYEAQFHKDVEERERQELARLIEKYGTIF